MGDDLVGDIAVGVVDGVAEVEGGPQDAGVGDEGVALVLGGLVVVMSVGDLGLLGEEQVAAQAVEGFTPVELSADAAAEAWSVNQRSAWLVRWSLPYSMRALARGAGGLRLGVG